MKFDQGPKENKKEDFEKTKKKFTIWVENFIQSFYKNDYESTFLDSVEVKIGSLTGSGRYITPEMKDLTIIFGEKLTSFCKNIIFDKNYNKEKVQKFYENLYETFFNKSPNIFENINIDYIQKLILSSEINETYKLRNVADMSGEIAYDLSFNSKDGLGKIAEKIKTLSESKKISVIKTLSNVAIRSYGDGSWAHVAFKDTINFIQKVRDEEKIPIVSFVADFELKKIINFSNNLNNFEEIDSIEDYEEENIYNDEEDVRLKISLENDSFSKENIIIPQLENIYYTNVSKDYENIVLKENLIPIALIKKPKQKEKRVTKENNLPFEEIKKLNSSLEYLNNSENKNSPHFYNNVGNIVDYLDNIKPEEVSLNSVLEKENLTKLKENIQGLYKIEEKIKTNENYVTTKIEQENYNKTKEIFDYIDKNFDNIFIEKQKYLGEEWLTYKKEKYNDGLFKIMSQLAMDIKDYTSFSLKKESAEGEKEESLTPIQRIKIMAGKLKNFHIKNWESEKQKTYELNEPYYKEYNDKILEVIEIVKKISIKNLKSVIKEIIEIDSSRKNTLPIKNYDGFTTEKEFNPFGNDDFSHLIKILHTPEIKNYINDRLNIKTEDLFLKEQIYFLKFLSTSSKETFEKLEIILKKNNSEENNTFLRSFLSMSGNNEMGDKILELGEKLPEDTAKIIFAKYGEYIDAVNDVEELINKTYKLPPSPELINKIKENLLIRGRDLLIKQNEEVEKGEFSQEKFLESLENTKADVDLFKNLFKIAKKENPDLGFENFIDLKMNHSYSSDQVTKEEISEMRKIIEQNYPEEKLRQAVLKSWQEKIDTGYTETDFMFLKKGQKIIAFDRVDYKQDGSAYFGSFNVDPIYCNSKIGTAFFQVTIEPLMKRQIVHADCSSRQPIASYYIESGFVADKSYEFAGEPSLSLESDPKKHWASKDLSKEEIINKFLQKENTENILIHNGNSQEELITKGIPENYVLTRYFFDKKEKMWFSVFEKNI